MLGVVSFLVEAHFLACEQLLSHVSSRGGEKESEHTQVSYPYRGDPLGTPALI